MQLQGSLSAVYCKMFYGTPNLTWAAATTDMNQAHEQRGICGIQAPESVASE